MPDRTSRPDPNELAKSIVDQLTGSAPRPSEPADAPPPSEPEKNPAAVALGRLGGKKGGPARAKALSKKRRAEIAKKAAVARWRQKPR
jgi:hypothetical protein